jgi:hypothetical protein
MGTAIHPHIENTDAEWVYEISGKSLSRNREKLFKLIKNQGHKDLMDYYVPSQEDLDDWGGDQKPEVKWFNPMEGIALIDAITRAFEQYRDEFERPEHLEADLKNFRAILDRAAAEGLRWNLSMSY